MRSTIGVPGFAVSHGDTRTWVMFGLPAAITLTWLIAVVATGELGRTLDRWEASVTMVFGSFLAGSSPAGAGIVAFPVFTKVLDVPAELARTFTLTTQAVGLTVAALIIVIARREIDRRVAAVGIPVGIAGFLVALFALGEPSRPFWPFTVSPAFVKVTFTLLLAALAFMMFLMRRQTDMGSGRIVHWNVRVWLGLVAAAFLGGLVTGLTGIGVNVLVFLFAVVLAGLHPRAGVPTSICIMAGVSIAGLIVLALIDGQFDVTLSPDGAQAVAVDGRPFGPVDAGSYDLLGFWLASVPIVVWGAPLGSWVVARLHERRLVQFLALLAATEVVSTAVLVDELHKKVGLAAYGVVGLVVVVGGIAMLRHFRHRLLDLPLSPRAVELTGEGEGPGSGSG